MYSLNNYYNKMGIHVPSTPAYGRERFEGPFVPLGLCSSPLTSYQRHKGHHILKTQIFHVKMMRRWYESTIPVHGSRVQVLEKNLIGFLHH